MRIRNDTPGTFAAMAIFNAITDQTELNLTRKTALAPRLNLFGPNQCGTGLMPIDTVTVTELWIDNLSDLLCHNEEVVCDFTIFRYDQKLDAQL